MQLKHHTHVITAIRYLDPTSALLSMNKCADDMNNRLPNLYQRSYPMMKMYIQPMLAGTTDAKL